MASRERQSRGKTVPGFNYARSYDVLGGLEIHIHVASALQRCKRGASGFGLFNRGEPLRNVGKHSTDYTAVTT
jgi:hypothetical protein